MRFLAFCASSAALAATVAACSGAAPSDLFATPDGSTTPTPTGTTPVEPPPVLDAGDPSPFFDAGPDATKPPVKDAGADANVVIDAGPPKPTVICGNGSCDPQTQFCCNKWNGSTYVPACQSLGTLCNPGTLVYCDGNSDCPNNGICCGSLYNQQYYTEVRCTQTCTGYVGQYAQIRFCDPKAVPDDCLGTGLTCQPSSIFPPYHVCR
jgi:hypothetical protein